MVQDSIVAVQEQTAIPGELVIQQPAVRPRTPYQVLRALPRDATPAQQDSAIQAAFHPSEIRYSSQPDTLHLPGHAPARSLTTVDIPKYYKEGFFSKYTLLHPELSVERYGVAGDPIPYTIRGDNMITSLLLACFILAVIAISNARRFIARQAKDFFYTPREGTTVITETSSELRFQTFLVMLTSLLLALIFYFYTTTYIGDTFILQSQYHLIAIYFGATMGYFLTKALLYTAVNAVFFDSKRNVQWMKVLVFITSIEGALLFPAVMLQTYFDLKIQNVTTYFIIVLVLVKLLTIYKCYVIFFRRNVVSLQIILYFCTLEMIPMLAFWRALVIIGNYLKINF
ncbi:MAG: DUF4271 domain-containing protein [Prevotella sp.]|nr:DUF4271 domain-containing protein [Prevotella sp.]